jgi:hypothetical protein
MLEAPPSSGPGRKPQATRATSTPARIRRREIAEGDLDGIIDLLTRGFPARGRNHWINAFKRLSDHLTPAGLPRYGFLLESKGAPVGASLHIYSSVPVDGEPRIRCNLSSWYVEPEYRSYATVLASEGLKQKNVTFFNATPAPHTLKILEAQGYERYCQGWFAAFTSLSSQVPGVQIVMATPETCRDSDLRPFEKELLLSHASYGCLSVICKVGNRALPFVFMPRQKFGLLRFAYLVYCPDLNEFTRYAGSLGRFLTKAGYPFVVVDSDGPIQGLVGKYLDARPKYFKGPHRPRLGDLAYSELAMFPVRGDRFWQAWKRNSPESNLSIRRWVHSK